MPKEPKWNGQWHPVAERFPMLSEDEIRQMAESIREAGQIDPCIMDPGGLGLDGRNRVAACRIIGVDPKWTVYDGDPYDLIAARNLRHRNMNTGQRAMAEAVLLEAKGMREERRDGKGWRWKRGSIPDPPDSLENQNSWRYFMSIAGTVLDYLPHLADAVLSGESIDAAYDQAKIEKDRREGEEIETRRRRERAAALPNDLAALVDNGVRDLDDAECEAKARKVVAEVDAIRNGDGAPPPSFTDRVQDGTLTWPEAQTLAEEWKQERTATVQRYHHKFRSATDVWQAVRDLVADPDHPLFLDALDGLEQHRQDMLRDMIQSLKEAA